MGFQSLPEKLISHLSELRNKLHSPRYYTTKFKAGQSWAIRRVERLKKQEGAAEAVSRDAIYTQKQAVLTLLKLRHCSRIFTHHLTEARSVLCDLSDIT